MGKLVQYSSPIQCLRGLYFTFVCFVISPVQSDCLLWLFALALFTLYFAQSDLRVHRVGHVFFHVSLSLPVLSVSAVVAQAPVISVEPQTATVRQGETVNFRCQVVRGTPPPTVIEWKKTNNPQMPGQEKQ